MRVGGIAIWRMRVVLLKMLLREYLLGFGPQHALEYLVTDSPDGADRPRLLLERYMDVAMRGIRIEETASSKNAERQYPRAGVCSGTTGHDPAGWLRGD